MNAGCKILLASASGLALAACSTTGTRPSTDNGISQYNTDATGGNAAEAPSVLGTGGPGGTGTASSVMTPTAPASNSQQQ
jgi:hypothetical protein